MGRFTQSLVRLPVLVEGGKNNKMVPIFSKEGVELLSSAFQVADSEREKAK